jgi:N-acyl-D-aspartate/D-glutamate deacylase
MREEATLASLIIRNARVVDGTGSPAFDADIAIDDGVITRIAPNIDEPAGRVIDAAGKVAAPGFIDIHAHGELSALTHQTADSKIHDGVTTEVLGNCGSTPFPVQTHGGYRTAAEFFDAVTEAGSSINRAFLAGLGAIRELVMGRTDAAASADDIARMRTEAERALDDGAFGVSSGLIYPPGCFSDQEEIAGAVKAAGEVGALYCTHMRSEGNQIEEAIDEAEFIARTSGARLQISHVKLSGPKNWDKIDWLDQRLHDLAENVDLVCDRYTYTASATNMGVILPNWVHEGPSAMRMARLKDPDTRARIEREMYADYPDPGSYERVLISSVPEDADPSFVGKTVAEIGQTTGQRPVDIVLDLLGTHEQKPGVIFFTMNEDNLRRILTWPFVGVGSDARAQIPRGEALKAKPHPRAYGTFSRLLGKYVRDEKLMPLEEAIRKITSLPAERLGLTDRGVLREGAAADITVLDPDTVTDRATFTDPHQLSTGISHVIVNGEPVIEDSAHNRQLPGKVLKRT